MRLSKCRLFVWFITYLIQHGAWVHSLLLNIWTTLKQQQKRQQPQQININHDMHNCIFTGQLCCASAIHFMFWGRFGVSKGIGDYLWRTLPAFFHQIKVCQPIGRNICRQKTRLQKFKGLEGIFALGDWEPWTSFKEFKIKIFIFWIYIAVDKQNKAFAMIPLSGDLTWPKWSLKYHLLAIL